jgi:hypothetical protein
MSRVAHLLTAGAGASFEAETTALLARMSVQPSSARQTAMNDLIAGLKADGIWTKLSGFFDFATEASVGEQGALLNWTRTQQATNANSCLYTALQGYKSTAAGTAHIDLGFKGGDYLDSQNSLSFGCWTNAGTTSPASSTIQIGSTGTGRISFTANGSTFNETFKVNDGTGTSVARGGTSSRIGHRAASRVDAANKTAYFNGVVASGMPVAVASAGLSVGNFAVFRDNASYNTVADGVCFVWIASGLDATEQANIHSRLSTYKTAAGIT